MVLEHLPGDQGDVEDLPPVHAGHRVEVDAQLVGVVEVLGQHRMRIEVDAAEVDHPASPAASRSTASLADVPEAYFSSATSIQSGRFSGARFWKKASCVDALDEAFEDHRAARDAAQRAVRDGEVVADQVQLGDARDRAKTTLSGWVMVTCCPPTSKYWGAGMPSS